MANFILKLYLQFSSWLFFLAEFFCSPLFSPNALALECLLVKMRYHEQLRSVGEAERKCEGEQE